MNVISMVSNKRGKGESRDMECKGQQWRGNQ